MCLKVQNDKKTNQSQACPRVYETGARCTFIEIMMEYENSQQIHVIFAVLGTYTLEVIQKEI